MHIPGVPSMHLINVKLYFSSFKRVQDWLKEQRGELDEIQQLIADL